MIIIGHHLKLKVGEIYTMPLYDVHGKLHQVTFHTLRDSNYQEWEQSLVEMGGSLEKLYEKRRAGSRPYPYFYEIQTD